MKDTHQTVRELEQACWKTLGTLYHLGYRDIEQLRTQFEAMMQHLMEPTGGQR